MKPREWLEIVGAVVGLIAIGTFAIWAWGFFFGVMHGHAH